MPKLLRYFLISAGMLLILTGLAKIISSFGKARILGLLDPVLNIEFRHVFLFVGLLELVLGLFCIFSKRVRLQSMLVAYFAGCVLLYRLGLLVVGYRKFCSCLGNLTDAIRIPPQTADMTMKIVLAYFIVGGYGAMFWLWRQKQKAPVPLPSKDATVSVV